MTLSYRVISIGTLASHPLWNEPADVRTGHTTTVLIESGEQIILVDPGLPARALAARLDERSSHRPEDVTDVFLTNFQPDHRRGLELFPRARWLLHEPERVAAESTLRHRIAEAEESGDEETASIFREDLIRLGRFEVPADRLAPSIDLFPLPGVTPGHCGLIVSLPGLTLLLTGDAIPTIEHLEEGKVLPGCVDVESAQESFRECVEIADMFILGRDNVMLNLLRRTTM